MALNIKNEEVERLASEMAAATGETKTETIRKALLERRERLALRNPVRDRGDRLRRFLEREVWPRVPEAQRGRAPDRAEVERILGYGSLGV